MDAFFLVINRNLQHQVHRLYCPNFKSDLVISNATAKHKSIQISNKFQV